MPNLKLSTLLNEICNRVYYIHVILYDVALAKLNVLLVSQNMTVGN